MVGSMDILFKIYIYIYMVMQQPGGVILNMNINSKKNIVEG